MRAVATKQDAMLMGFLLVDGSDEKVAGLDAQDRRGSLFFRNT